MNARPELGSDNSELLRNEGGQAKVRIGVCFFMAVYFYATGFTNHPLYILFIGYCFASLLLTHRSTCFSRIRSFTSLLIDNFFAIAGLHVTGEYGTFLFILLVQIAFGNGLRFGRLYLWSWVFVACIGILTLYFLSTPWQENLHLVLTFFIGTPFIAFYVDYLVKNLRKSKLEADKRASDISDLLAFVSHDIRTPLHSLLTTAAVAKTSAQDNETRTRLVRIENTIKSLARLATDVLGATAGVSQSIRERRSVVSICSWIVDVSRRFSDELESNQITLIYKFNMTIWPAVSINILVAERLLLNILSNAVRFSNDGEIDISLNYIRRNETSCDLLLSVTNRQRKLVDRTTPVAINVSHHNPDEYYGAGLGLIVSKELASSLGGEFSFRRNDDGEYVTDIRVPCERADNSNIQGIVYPVVLITRNGNLVSRMREILGNETNVIVFNEISNISRKMNRISALIIDEETLQDSFESDTYDSGFFSANPFSIISSRKGHKCEEIKALAFNSLTFDASKDEIINTVRSQVAAREIEVSLEPDQSANFRAALTGVRFLVVDDNHVNRELLEEGITNTGAYFSGAKSISDGIRFLKNSSFDVILLDWNIGTRSGALMLEHLSTLESDARPIAFILSSETSTTIANSAVSPFITEIIVRPISIDQVLRIVSNYIQGEGQEFDYPGNLSGIKIFDANLYEELIAGGTPRRRISELLDQFRSEVADLLSRVEAAIDEHGPTQFASRVHAVRSVCFASGAYQIGDYFQVSTKQNEGAAYEMPISEKKRFLEPGLKLWDITLAHIDTYQMSL